MKLSGGLIALGVAALAIGFVAVNYFTYANAGATYETTIKAKYDDNRQILASYGQTISESVQIPGMARDDLIAVTNAAMEGRYGENGSQAVFQWIQENYPGSVSPQLYTNIQTSITAGRQNFSDNQRILIDTKRSYEAALLRPWDSFWLRLAGFPRIDLDDYNIVTSARSDEAFESGQDNGMTLRPQQPAATPTP